MKTDRLPTANTDFASGGVTCIPRALCFYSSSVQVDSFVLRIENRRSQAPPERKARKRSQTVSASPRFFFASSKKKARTPDRFENSSFT